MSRTLIATFIAIVAVAGGLVSRQITAGATTVEAPCSPTSGTAAKLSVTNQLSTSVDVYLVDSRCNLVRQASVLGNRTTTINSRIGNRHLVFPAGRTSPRLADKVVRSIADSVTITNRPPTVTMTSPTNGLNVAPNSRVTLTANASDPDGSIARVEFLVNGSVIDTEYVAPYTFSRTFTTAGSQRLNARAIDNRGASTTSADVILVVTSATTNRPPTVTMTSPTNGLNVAPNSRVTLSANASDPDGSIARVEFLVNGSVIDTEYTAPYTFSRTFTTAGSQRLNARAIDNRGASTTSADVILVVTSGTPPTTTTPPPTTTTPPPTTTTPPPTTTTPPPTTTTPPSTTTAPPTTTTPPGGASGILVLYDTTGPNPGDAQTTAAITATMAGHFGTVTTKAVSAYQAGDIGRFAQTIYIGTTFDEPLPAALLADAANPTRPLLWANYNIWQVVNSSPSFATRFGFVPTFFGSDPVSAIRYKGVDLPRVSTDQGLMGYTISDTALASVIGQGVTATGTIPWAVRSGNLTYIGENPFSFSSEGNRYLAFSDVLFDTLAPNRVARNRALVRLEDVDPTSDPANLRAYADYLFSRGVPFSVAVIPEYRDPVLSPGSAPIRMQDRPDFVAALQYMQSRGGTLIMHGYTHQLGDTANPFNGRSGTDYEFTTMSVDGAGNPVVVGPPPNDTVTAQLARFDAGLANFAAAGLARPTIFEFPHYIASINSYLASRQRFATRYERITYFPGVLGGTVDFGRFNGAILPYSGRDIWGARIIPENLGYVITGVTTPQSILANATRLKVVRDSVASFFYHPYLPIADLRTVVEGLQAQGWTFVAPSEV